MGAPRSSRIPARAGARRIDRRLSKLFSGLLSVDDTQWIMRDAERVHEVAGTARVYSWDGSAVTFGELETIADLDPATLEPVRRLGTWQQARSKMLLHSTRFDGYTHSVLGESILEGMWMKALDRTNGLVGYIGQPLIVRWTVGSKAIIHLPDMLVSHRGHDTWLLDVRPDALMDTPGGQLMATLMTVTADLAGVRYHIAGSMSPQHRQNLDNLAMSRWGTSVEDTDWWTAVDRARPETIRALAEIAGDEPIGISRALRTLAQCKCHADLTRTLTLDTRLEWNTGMINPNVAFGLGSEWVHDGRRVQAKSVNVFADEPMVTLFDEKNCEKITVRLIDALRSHNVEVRPERGRISDLENVPPADLDLARERFAHMRDMVHGRVCEVDGTRPDSRYDVMVTNESDRIKNKIEELKGKPGYSSKNIYKLLKRFKESGERIESLVRYGTREVYNPESTLRPETVQSVRSAITELTAQSTGATGHRSLVINVRGKLHEWGISDENLTHHRLDKLVEQLSNEITKDTTRTRENSRSRRISGYRRPRPTRYLERVEIDATPLNQVCGDIATGAQFRPYALIAVDVQSTLYKSRLTPSMPTARDVRLLLFDMLLPIVQPEVVDKASRSGLIGLPEKLILRMTDEIGTVVIDNGSQMMPITSKDIVKDLGIDVEFCRTHTPSDKPYVESRNRSLDLLQQLFPEGYVGRNAEYRGKDTQPIFTFQGLNFMMQDFASREYPGRVSPNLRSDLSSKVFMSPVQKLAESITRGGLVETSIHPDDVYGLLESEERRATQGRVEFDGIAYVGPELKKLVGDSLSSVPVRLYYDYADRSRIFFFMGKTESWCELQAIDDYGEAVPPMSDILIHPWINFRKQGRLTRNKTDDADLGWKIFFMEQAKSTPGLLALDRANVSTRLPSPSGTPGARVPGERTAPGRKRKRPPEEFPIDIDDFEHEELNVARYQQDENEILEQMTSTTDEGIWKHDKGD
ncbi:Mu transposase C-terminal domain-containing protein [Gordonia sputi]|nr:Mu transposase C-terminal domain-containing protein [Gordonia sputi]NKY95968.1 transposase [Gordonia sputi]